jgi:hypothetical protein
VELLADGDRLKGLVFQKTSVTDQGVLPIPDTEHEVLSPLVISSIGSLPEEIPGIPMQRDLYRIENKDTGKLVGLDGVFALGNAVTGRGNIRASRLHAREVAEWVIENYLDWTKLEVSGGMLAPKSIEQILQKASEFQGRVGYDGDYKKWITKHLPARLEDLASD